MAVTVSGVERAKALYREKVGFDVDMPPGNSGGHAAATRNTG